jgi:hypothetical protein
MYRTLADQLSVRPLSDKVIVLDLDETLVHTMDDINSMYKLNIFTNPEMLDLRQRIYTMALDDVMNKKGMGQRMEMYGLARPHYEEFLLFCFEYFQRVVVWTAARREYAIEITDFLFRNLRQPDLLLTWDDCHVVHNAKDEIIVCDKPLTTVYKYLGRDIANETNTLIVDNTQQVFADANFDNGILIPDYKPSATIASMRKDDKRLLELKRWFLTENVFLSTDVRTLTKNLIFS